MPYWEYELYLKSMKIIIEEENKRQEEAEKGHSSRMPNYQKQAQQYTPKPPRMPSMPRMPRI